MANNIRDAKFIRFENGVSRQIVEIDCDTPADLPEPPDNWLMGSIAHVISTGDFYELNSSGEWVNQTGEEETETVTASASALNSPLVLEKTISEPENEMKEVEFSDAELS